MRQGFAVRLIGCTAVILALMGTVLAFSYWWGEDRITDSRTPLELPKGIATSGKQFVDFYSDGMSGKQGDYATDIDGQLLIDPDAYKLAPPQRGDVVWFTLPAFEHRTDFTPPKQTADRVIALAGERVSVRKGVIYINAARLDTFYGRILMWGQTEREFFANSTESSCPEACVKGMRDYFNQSVPELTVPAGTVYVLGDSSGRSLDSAQFGPLDLDLVLGKVVGATGQPKLIGKG